MSMFDDQNEIFDDLAARAGHVVGDAELQAREAMGDENYEYIRAVSRIGDGNNMEMAKANIELTKVNVEQVKANTRLTNAHFAYRTAVAKLALNAAAAVPFGILFGIAWTIYFFVAH
jgi:hypothetical protein